VCLVTVAGEGMSEASLRDNAQYAVRNQIANVPGASVPQPFGGRYRQIMVYVDPQKLEAHQLSPMDVVRAVNNSNLILPAGDVRIGELDYSLYTNSQIDETRDIDRVPLKTDGRGYVTVADVGQAMDSQQIQNNIVRVNGQKAVYLSIQKQGGDSNTIQVVDGVKTAVAGLTDVPEGTDRAGGVRSGGIRQAGDRNAAARRRDRPGADVYSGALFLGSFRATAAGVSSIPLSALATFLIMWLGGNSINTMVLGGLALAFSRIIDNSVVVLENIYRHLEHGVIRPKLPSAAAAK
jgi:multidrug efflux pump subunit AcrB